MPPAPEIMPVNLIPLIASMLKIAPEIVAIFPFKINESVVLDPPDTILALDPKVIAPAIVLLPLGLLMAP